MLDAPGVSAGLRRTVSARSGPGSCGDGAQCARCFTLLLFLAAPTAGSSGRLARWATRLATDTELRGAGAHDLDRDGSDAPRRRWRDASRVSPGATAFRGRALLARCWICTADPHPVAGIALLLGWAARAGRRRPAHAGIRITARALGSCARCVRFGTALLECGAGHSPVSTPATSRRADTRRFRMARFPTRHAAARRARASRVAVVMWHAQSASLARSSSYLQSKVASASATTASQLWPLRGCGCAVLVLSPWCASRAACPANGRGRGRGAEGGDSGLRPAR